MGCDIFSFAEVRRNGKWHKVEEKVFSPDCPSLSTTEPFGWRSYGIFGFLANVRNYSKIPFIGLPKGLPLDSEYLNSTGVHEDTIREDIIDWGGDSHNMSFLLLQELLNVNYDDSFNNQRDEEEGIVTYREFLGEGFFEDLTVLKSLGSPDDVRIVFWFMG